MFRIFKKMASRYNSYMTMVARKRTLEVLLNSCDRLLEDAGFSRDLLEQGVDAWPWRIDMRDQVLRPIVSNLTIDESVNETDIPLSSANAAVQVQSADTMHEDERYVA